MISKDYKGPVSGRVVIGGGDNPEITHESFTQEQDPVPTRDEANATAWFRALPPNEQLREVRRLKWNLDQAASDRDKFEKIVRRQDAEILQLRAELATHVPHGGYVWPRAARGVLDHAKANGWKTAYAWQEITPRDEEDDQEPYARLGIKIGKDGRTFKYTWACDRNGSGRMTGRALAWDRGWHDAPSLIKLRKIIEQEEQGS